MISVQPPNQSLLTSLLRPPWKLSNRSVNPILRQLRTTIKRWMNIRRQILPHLTVIWLRRPPQLLKVFGLILEINNSIYLALGVQIVEDAATKSDEQNAAGSDDVWAFEANVFYRWKDWRLIRSKDSLFIWCDAIALELRFFEFKSYPMTN
jgi:hypothetical protein